MATHKRRVRALILDRAKQTSTKIWNVADLMRQQGKAKDLLDQSNDLLEQSVRDTIRTLSRAATARASTMFLNDPELDQASSVAEQEYADAANRHLKFLTARRSYQLTFETLRRAVRIAQRKGAMAEPELPAVDPVENDRYFIASMNFVQAGTHFVGEHGSVILQEHARHFETADDARAEAERLRGLAHLYGEGNIRVWDCLTTHVEVKPQEIADENA